MNHTVDIAALAKLARLEVSEAELAKLNDEIPHILEFVESIQTIAVGATEAEMALRNVLRDDLDAYTPGAFSEALLEGAPARSGDYVAVKQVLSRKKAS